MITRYQDEIAETLATRWGRVLVLPLRDGTGAVVAQGFIHDIPMGDALYVPEELGARHATPGELRRVFVDGQPHADDDCPRCGDPVPGGGKVHPICKALGGTR